MSKKVVSLLIAITMLIAQFTFLGRSDAKASTNASSVEVIFVGPQNELFRESSDKLNALEAAKDAAKKRGFELVENFGFVDGLKHLSDSSKSIMNYTDSSNTWHGWMYTVKKSGKYDKGAAFKAINEFEAEPGDTLIMYYSYFKSDYTTTLLANKISFSNTLPNKETNIDLINIDYYSGTEKKILGAEAKIDGIPIEVIENRISLKNGLIEGVHTLEISDWQDNDGEPKFLADSFSFEIKYPLTHVRIEGLSGTLAEGTAKGSNGLEIVKKVLENNSLSYVIKTASWGSPYLSSIGELGENKFNSMDGWMYFIKSPNGVQAPSWGLDGYVPAEGESLVVYYGGFDTPYVNNIVFDPEVVKENKSFKISFNYKYFDYSKWPEITEVSRPVEGAIVKVDDTNYITNTEGEITVNGLSNGEHTYMISGYNINQLPTVVMDKGTFIIDGVHSPNVYYRDSKYDEVLSRDNNVIVKNINVEIESSLNYIKSSHQDPWSSITLNKFSIKGDESFIKSSFVEIKENGADYFNNTELEKLIINLTALGYSPYSFSGNDLVAELLNRDIKDFLINDLVFSELVYRYCNVQGDYRIKREDIANAIMAKKLSYKSGDKDVSGWTLMGNKVNPDITGMVINALSVYYDKAEVRSAVDNAVNSLSIIQTGPGYIADEYGFFSESLSFTILGLTSIGVNPEGVLFTKEKGDLVSGLLSFKGTDGQFKHAHDGQNNYIATEQALRALVALSEFKKSGKYDFYHSSIKAAELPVFNYVVPDKPAAPTEKPSTVKPAATGNTGTSNPDATAEDVNSKVSNNLEEIKKAMEISASSGEIIVDASNNPTVSKEVFDLIKGKDITLTFEANGLIWRFNGKDIINESRNVDLGLNEVPENREEINKRVNDVFVISFKNSGLLPGKARITINPDKNWASNKNTLYLYYFNPGSKEFEKIDGPLSVDKDGSLTFTITHNSDYILTDKVLGVTNVNKGAEKAELKPEKNITGFVGIGFVALGFIIAVVLVFSKKSKEGRSV